MTWNQDEPEEPCGHRGDGEGQCKNPANAILILPHIKLKINACRRHMDDLIAGLETAKKLAKVFDS